MNTEREILQAKFDSAYENYFALSDVLLGDLQAILGTETETGSWKRNFVRASAALLEGYAHSLRELVAVGLECEAPELSQKEKKVVLNERSVPSDRRLKLSLRAAYKMFSLSSSPGFDGPEWPKAQILLKRRDRLMHPKSSEDLEIPECEWRAVFQNVAWLTRQFVSFHEQMQGKYVGHAAN